ncbi:MULTISPECIES: type II secretion system protein [Pseudoalteromonas]|uniref:type II secretion system protein n=1 Tax=Pseudoalteromonas TaxID=53246 RepID=UPI0015815BB9|nr:MULTISPECIES: prepilin-type N-terminal cleavage/methylation domain-containing protein [Pseudoalteromonas]MDI4652083.1 prepilin-type N-terminal cleavage/methylation domain-containing protein [Pseudoalteromonas shioyasakiensis]NUJ38408.1 prepilin-type N-terminal cleavage/methylation domain-containing protein [Pseudoalteromonas sp. 0303]
MYMQNNKGFTIIEVLISGVILFIALSLVYEAFSHSLINTKSAEKSIKFNAAIPIIVPRVSIELNNNLNKKNMTGQGKLGEISYEWKSRKLKESLLKTQALDEGTVKKTILVFEVSIRVYMSESDRLFTYKETVWY